MAEVSMIFDWGKTESSDAIKVNFNKHPFNGIFFWSLRINFTESIFK